VRHEPQETATARIPRRRDGRYKFASKVKGARLKKQAAATTSKLAANLTGWKWSGGHGMPCPYDGNVKKQEHSQEWLCHESWMWTMISGFADFGAGLS
jgi:hypothetical protein